MAYVYRHIRLDTNQPFYIGVGTMPYYGRAYSSKTRNKYWRNITLNTPFRVDILLDNISREEAIEKEKEFIALYGRTDLKKGCLCNLTDGGDGVLGHPLSLENRYKLSENMKGKKNHMFGKKQSAETIAKRAAKMTGFNNPWYGKTFSAEYREKLSKAKVGKRQSKEQVAKRILKITGLKRSPTFCENLRIKSLEQSEQRRERALKQWANRKNKGFKNLTD